MSTPLVKRILIGFIGVAILSGFLATALIRKNRAHSIKQPTRDSSSDLVVASPPGALLRIHPLRPRKRIDTAGFLMVDRLVQWKPDASLPEIGAAWQKATSRQVDGINQELDQTQDPRERFALLVARIELLNFQGHAQEAYASLQEARELVERQPEMASQILATVVYMQGLTALRHGENENCILCRGESSCILPIVPAARHTRPAGSRRAVEHFQEYLERFPDDLGVRWLLNIAHMTLGEYPEQVDPRFLVPLGPLYDTASSVYRDHAIGRFRDIGHLVHVNQLGQAGGAILEDFDGDGQLDLATTSYDPLESLRILRNNGRGTFDDHTEFAGVSAQLGGLNCVQTDYNNDGFADILVIRGAWFSKPIRRSLLRNNGDGTFTDVTDEAGLADPANSIASAWSDYDNDGCVDLFVACERQPSRLYRNAGDGTFVDATQDARLTPHDRDCKGLAWIDFDNDGYQDLFLNYLKPIAGAQLFRNRRDGTFEDVTDTQGIRGPVAGFSCWTWDYNNDGWMDLFATTYDVELQDAVREITGGRHHRQNNRLYRNNQGRGFEDVAGQVGLDQVLGTMGSNFADFDNDGALDLYLGTGTPDLDMLIPNRMFRNLGGQQFVDITASSGTGNLQKGHGVACGDWDRDGDVDLFIQMGGATQGDRYHNILFANPGSSHHWLTLRLQGTQSNRAALGARIRIVTGGPASREIHRHVTSGSSFGANPLEQTIGLGAAERIETLEVTWPSSGIRQVFHDVAVDQSLSLSESDLQGTTLSIPRIDLPAVH